MIRPHLSTLALLAAALAPSINTPSLLPVRAPEPVRELTEQDFERIEAAKVKRQRRAARSGR